MDDEHSIELCPLDTTDTELASYSSRLQRYAWQYGIDLDEVHAILCIKHLLYVLQVNDSINLTRIENIDDGLVLHILDSLIFIKYSDCTSGTFLDMGTGAGFPGIPFHIVNGLEGTLLDSVSKKVKVVEKISSALGLTGLTCVHERIESFSSSSPQCFDIVLARAVASLPVLVEYASPCLPIGGQLVVSKGRPTIEERSHGDAAATICGFELVVDEELELPEGYGHRTMLVYEKVREPAIKLPRAIGQAKKHPLG